MTSTGAPSQPLTRWVVLGIAVALLATFAPSVEATLGAPSTRAAGSDAPYLTEKVPVAPGCITLGRAWAGVKVHLVQRRLGTTSDKDRYLADTKRAVEQFQSRRGLDVTGRVNRATWKKLQIGRPFCMDRFTVQPRLPLSATADERIAAMLGWAKEQQGRRYVWGGAGPVGYDCSGLALQAMHAAGLALPTVTTYLHQRQDFGTATAIYESGLKRVPFAKRKKGDLVFYGPSGSMTHMALYLGNDRILEAVRPEVRRSSVWSPGVPVKPDVVRPFPRQG